MASSSTSILRSLLERVSEPGLRTALEAEIDRLLQTKQFGLVFEEHTPEVLPLLHVTPRIGSRVAIKGVNLGRTWVVELINEGRALLARVHEQEREERWENLTNIVVVRRFGEAIYPKLEPMMEPLERLPNQPFHTIIQSDNYHALQLLTWGYRGAFDVIYIDPPYNTGNRDWKYNNDYVDSNDRFRHSKWLSMMKKRLVVAKRLLKRDGVMVVTIDEHEVHHLGNLLEEELREFSLQMVTIVINQKGVAQGHLSRVEEYAFFCFGPDVTLPAQNDDLLTIDREERTRVQTLRWERLLRGGVGSRRRESPTLFFPIYIDPDVPAITSIGEPLLLDQEPELTPENEKKVAWPIRTDGSFGRWRVSPLTLREYVAKGYVKLGGYDPRRKTWTILYLGRKAQKQIETGAIKVVGRDPKTNVVQLEYASGEQRQVRTVWHRGTHDAGNYGSTLLRIILDQGVQFSFPKSLYAVRDTLRILTGNRPNALILDYFAGSGTTLHATALLNAEDGGNRRCILVTNNEVSEAEAKAMTARGLQPGDEEWEAQGICRSVTIPRCKYALRGQRDDGTPLLGSYLNGRAISEGFPANLRAFRLDFLDPSRVERGCHFEDIAPILWLMAGAQGACDPHNQADYGTFADERAWWIPPGAPLAVLLDEHAFSEFAIALLPRVSQSPSMQLVCLVTDSHDAFNEMSAYIHELLPDVSIRMLYRNYLDNFQLQDNTLLKESPYLAQLKDSPKAQPQLFNGMADIPTTKVGAA